MKILLIRHAEKIEDKNTAPLTKKGFKQANYLANCLKKIKIDKFYCSEFLRAIQTAEIVSKKIKIKPTREKSLNEYDTILLKTNFKKASKEEKNRLSKLKIFIKKIVKNKDSDELILIVAHGITNRIIFSELFGIEMNKLIGFMQNETGITEIKWNSEYKNWRLLSWSNTSHLPKKLK